MKITSSVDLAKGRLTEAPTPAASQPSAAGAKPSAPAAEGTTIHLSGMSGQLQSMASTLAASGEFDATKVDAIKQAIRDGQLRVNPEVIADKMLSDLRDSMAGQARA